MRKKFNVGDIFFIEKADTFTYKLQKIIYGDNGWLYLDFNRLSAPFPLSHSDISFLFKDYTIHESKIHVIQLKNRSHRLTKIFK